MIARLILLAPPLLILAGAVVSGFLGAASKPDSVRGVVAGSCIGATAVFVGLALLGAMLVFIFADDGPV